MTAPIQQAGPRAVPGSPVGTPVSAPPDSCRYCGGAGVIVYEDEAHPCYCQQPDADVAAKELA